MVKKKPKYKPTRRPTPKQRKLVRAISDNIRKPGPAKSIKKLMIDVGYSKTQASKPAAIIESKNFLDLLEKHGVSDNQLAKVAAEGLNLQGTGNGRMMIKHKFLETGLKLRKHLTPGGEELADAFRQMIQFNVPPHDVLPEK